MHAAHSQRKSMSTSVSNLVLVMGSMHLPRFAFQAVEKYFSTITLWKTHSCDSTGVGSNVIQGLFGVINLLNKFANSGQNISTYFDAFQWNLCRMFLEY